MHWIYYIVREADLGHALWNRFWINGLNFSHGIYYIISFYLLMSLLLTDNILGNSKKYDQDNMSAACIGALRRKERLQDPPGFRFDDISFNKNSIAFQESFFINNFQFSFFQCQCKILNFLFLFSANLNFVPKCICSM